MAMGAVMQVNRKYKSSVFTLLFSEPEKLRELYNALSKTQYDESAFIKINTLSDAIFMDRINDISFTINDKLVIIIEHQSTINPNMALRLLHYISRIYEKLVDKRAIYSRKKITIPRPEFIVLYNGRENYPDESIMKLSEHFEQTGNEDIALELEARICNINKGHNENLERRCRTLADYTEFVAKVRNYEQESDLRNAVRKAITECVRRGILQEFLEEHSSEVMNMLITEWNWDDAKAVWYAEGKEEGLQVGTLREKLEIARKLKAGGFPPEQIAELTGLSGEALQL
jgi:predicted transposase/invertase (TIGR01784 family)